MYSILTLLHVGVLLDTVLYRYLQQGTPGYRIEPLLTERVLLCTVLCLY